MSHTVRVKIEMRKPEALEAAVIGMGGTFLGQGSHKLYGRNREEGFGFKLPGWSYPLILKADGTLAFDDYHGMWGNTADLARLTARYAIEAARQAAEAQAWLCEDEADGALTIHHPSGGHLRVEPDGTVDAVGFIGSDCDVAQVIEDAMGSPADRINKPEFSQIGDLKL